MTGLLLIAIFGMWLFVVAFISRWATRRFKSRTMTIVSGTVAFWVLLPAPLIDELIGKWQFESLCKKYAVVEIDERNATNRRVVTEIREIDKYVEGTAVKIRIDPYVYRDEETNKIVVSYHTLHAQGGWLIRFLGISETNAPLLFRSGCAPVERYAFKEKFNIKVIN